MKSQVISITPDNTLPGQTLLTSISLTSVAINVASPPHQMNDIYLKQGNQFIYATSYNVHATSPGNLDSITVNFSIPQNAFTGLYDVHVNRYTWFQGQPSPPIDNVLLNGFLIGVFAGIIEGEVYYDANQNGIRDTNEFSIPNIQIKDNTTGSIALTNSQGHYEFRADSGLHSIGINLLPPFTLSTIPSVYNINLPPSSTGNDFGLHAPTSAFHTQSFTMLQTLMRCFALGEIIWTITNTSNLVHNGSVTLIHSPNINSVYSDAHAIRMIKLLPLRE